MATLKKMSFFTPPQLPLKRLAEDNSPRNATSQRMKAYFANKKRKVVPIHSEPKCYEMNIAGMSVDIPSGLVLYRTQKLTMIRIIQAIKKSQSVLVESPTGSGKTLSLLASTCGWLRDHQKTRKSRCPIHNEGASTSIPMNFVPPPSASHTSNLMIKKEEPEDECAIVYDSTDGRSLSADLSMASALTTGSEYDFKRVKVSDLLKNPLILCAEQEQTEEEKKPECECLERSRIYYCTRTHKQIGQVVKEFGRMGYYTTMKHTILGSREQACVNADVRKNADITGACKERIAPTGIGCTFKTNMRGSFEKGPQIRDLLKRGGAWVWDMEELVRVLGSDEDTPLCPYFSATRVLTQDADIIFCPFNYLIDPIIRNSSDVHLKNAIIILDEAHNVEDNCRDAASFTFTEREIHDGIASLREKKGMVMKARAELEKDGGDNVNDSSELLLKLQEFGAAIDKLLSVSTELQEWLMDVQRDVPQPNENDRFGKSTTTKGWEYLAVSLQDQSHNRRLMFDRTSERYRECNEAMGKLSEREQPQEGSSVNRNWTLESFRPSSTAIVLVEKFLYFASFFTQERHRSMYRLNITLDRQTEAQRAMEDMNSRKTMGGGFGFSHSGGPRNSLYHAGMELRGPTEFIDTRHAQTSAFNQMRKGYKVTASMWCMSPELAFKDAFDDCRSVILASGTLCPTDTLKTELGTPFHVEVEGEQVIPREQIFAAVVQNGPRGTAMRATFQNTNNDHFIDELANIIKSATYCVPGGVLCFLPSYRLLDRLYERMHQTGILRQIELRKKVVREPRYSAELTNVMAEYERGIAEGNGSLMFAVFRGKVSEGIDFADDRARCVISVGIPYPNAYDELVLEKKKYNNENATKLRILTGDQWYTSQAYRALNQGLGRCLRHRGDWGAIVMVDERLAYNPNTSHASANSAARVSKWIREHTINYNHFNEFEEGLREFVERMTVRAICKTEEV